MTTEKTTIEIERYRDPSGKPTCAVDFNGGKVCQFMALARMGTTELCALDFKLLHRRGDDGLGFLIPGGHCVAWTKEELEAK